MRLILGMTIGVAALTGLAGCGPSEQETRNSIREGMLLGCRSGGDASERAILNQAGIDIDRYCACAADRYMRSATAEQLKQLRANPANAPGLEAAAAQCMTEMTAQTPTPPAGNEAPAAPAAPEAPAPAAEEGEAAAGNEASGQ